MASSDGIGGAPIAPPSNGETTSMGDAEIGAGGEISVAGEVVDVGTPEGTATLVGAVSAEELATIKGMLQLKEVEGPDGLVLVPDDSYDTIDTETARNAQGPTASDANQSDIDSDLSGWFVSEGVPDPYNANTTPKLYEKIKDTPEFKQATGNIQNYFENPTDANLKTALTSIKDAYGAGNSNNVMEVLFLVFRESIKSTNEDKKYFLQKLQMFNKMGEQLSDYLSDLSQVSRDLGAASTGQKEPSRTMTPSAVEINQYDLTGLDSNGNLAVTSSHSQRLERAGLNSTIKDVEGMQETLRNKREMASTAFQNFDQKANQLYNMLATVMKSMNEMRMVGPRNMS